MIIVSRELLTQDLQDRIKEWLIAPGSQLVEELIKGQIAELSANASNSAMSKPVGVLSARDVPQDSKESMGAAAVLQLFLTTLDELRKQETFSAVTLKIQ